ncbi:ABC transporter permease [Alicyclobacillus dauci]|uniref:ABC transporter permease n=1 Tax=Alicyclobacillus dauci TaxID=1475485 RepID=A0ABY6YY90_9BACL|nr:ABC transporter permease [Alicyclobacillus dauci]WAH35580.1 ABC transporter permease [Alicyclobacillus dauci]
MLMYVAKRIAYIVVAFFAVSLITFILMKAAPGSFLAMNAYSGGVAAAATNFNVSQAVMQALQQQYHLNDPWYVQYWGYVWSFVTLHMGTSFEYPNQETLTIIAQTFPVSIMLAVLSIIVAIVLSVSFGVLSAMRENNWVDSTTMFVATMGTAVPSYVVAVFLMLVFGVWTHWLPVIGYQGPKYYVLPVLALAIPMIGSMSRYMRNSLIDTLHSDFIKTVLAKGGGMRQVMFGHGIRNSLLPFITVVGPQLAALMMGTVFIEQMFSVPGMAHVFTSAASQRDYPLIMDSTLLYAVVIMIMNLIVDLVYGLVDPRVRKTGYRS